MQELVRKLIHIILGLGIAGMVLFLDHSTVTAILAIGLFFGIILVDLVLRGYMLPVIAPILNYVDRDDPLPAKGALYFAISTLSCVILFPVPVVVPALVSWAVLDGIAAIAGRRFGSTRVFRGKSPEGTVAGILVTFPVLILLISWYGAMVVVVVAGILEMVSPVDDNLIIPVGICILFTAIPVLI